MNTSEQGRVGEALVVAHMVGLGYDIYLPAFGNAPCDIVAMRDGQMYRVECKSIAAKNKWGSYEAQLRRVRVNTTSTKIHHFDGKSSDILAVCILPEKRVILLDAIDYDGRSTVSFKPLAGGVEATNGS